MSLEPRIVKESFTRIEADGEKAAAYFYGRLFAENPRLRALFPPAMATHHHRFFHALTRIVWSLDNPGELAAHLGRLGRGHRRFGVLREHYPAVGDALIATLRVFSGDSWTPEAEAAWRAAYRAASDLMIAAAEEDAAVSPPWWVAEVIDHERRAPDIAVLSVRPGQPLPFTPGQHVSVQTSRWPRVWRPYSIANAPRSDGMLRLHVRALPGGWVSGALVRHTKVGDTLLLGPALGGLTLAPGPGSNSGSGPGRGLLLVAGGTGLAPLRALAEQVIMSGPRRDVHLLVGARTRRDLYDLPELRLMESSCPRLTVTPVLSDEPGFDGMRGLVPDALRDLDGWDDHDAYVAGPPEMVRRTVGELRRLGLPPSRIHHDPLETDVPVPALTAR